MLYYLATALFVLVCLTMMLVVYLQQGKGGDIAAAFGGASSQTAFGARAGATVLTRATTILGTMFLLGALGLSLMGRHGGSSVVSGVAAPATAPAQQTAPALPMPLSTTPAAATAPASSSTPAPAPAAPASTTPAPAPTPSR